MEKPYWTITYYSFGGNVCKTRRCSTLEIAEKQFKWISRNLSILKLEMHEVGKRKTKCLKEIVWDRFGRTI